MKAIEHLKKEKEHLTSEIGRIIEDLMKKIEDMKNKNTPMHKEDQFGSQGVVSTYVEAKVHEVAQEFECKTIEEKI